MSERPPSMLDRYVGRAAGSDLPPGADEGEPEILGCFGILRGMRERPACLELRLRSGAALAIPYSYISRIEYQPVDGILIHTGTEMIRLRGRNLNREVRPRITLFGSLARHAVSWVSEADRAAALSAGDGAVVVERIDW